MTAQYSELRVIDSHTGGEPTRLVIDGFPDLGTGNMSERRERFPATTTTGVKPLFLSHAVTTFWSVHCSVNRFRHRPRRESSSLTTAAF